MRVNDQGGLHIHMFPSHVINKEKVCTLEPHVYRLDLFDTTPFPCQHIRYNIASLYDSHSFEILTFLHLHATRFGYADNWPLKAVDAIQQRP